MSTILHRQHLIRTMKRGEEWAAVAFRGKQAFGATEIGPTEEAAILAVKGALDVAHERHLAARGNDGYPTVEEVRSALGVVKMTPEQRSMLTAHFWAPNHLLTATQLAAAGGYETYAAANSQYGTLGRSLSEALDWQPPLVNGVRTWTYTLATGACEATAGAEDEGQWLWKMRPQVVEALQADGELFDQRGDGCRK